MIEIDEKATEQMTIYERLGEILARIIDFTIEEALEDPKVIKAIMRSIRRKQKKKASEKSLNPVGLGIIDIFDDEKIQEVERIKNERNRV